MAKAGRPKNIRPHEIKLQLPKDPMKYQAKRLYWALLEYEKAMSKDITSVKMSEYNSLLTSYIDVCEKLKNKGITYGHNAQKRVDEERLDQFGHYGTKTRVGENGQAGVGTRVFPVNPLA